jgi:hypothetical protein
VQELINGLDRPDNWFEKKWADIYYFKLGEWQKYFNMPIKPAHYRLNCVRGIGILGTAASDAEPALVAALSDTDPMVRANAAVVLGQISNNRTEVALKLAATTNNVERVGSLLGLG